MSIEASTFEHYIGSWSYPNVVQSLERRWIVIISLEAEPQLQAPHPFLENDPKNTSILKGGSGGYPGFVLEDGASMFSAKTTLPRVKAEAAALAAAAARSRGTAALAAAGVAGGRR